MKRIMKHGDIVFGTVGTAGTFGLGTVNLWLGCVAGVLTVGVMAIRLRREWKHRNDPPKE
jgi:hypothetical protein